MIGSGRARSLRPRRRALSAAFAIAASVAFGASLWFVILIIAFFSWFYPGRIFRGEVQSLRNREFVTAARMVRNYTTELYEPAAASSRRAISRAAIMPSLCWRRRRSRIRAAMVAVPVARGFTG